MSVAANNECPVWGQNAGAGALGGHNNPAPATHTVGEVGFGPLEDDDEVRLTTKGYRQVCDGMARSIVRLEQENEELRAEVALLREEQVILKNDGLRIAVKATSWARLVKERDQWRGCAERLHAAVCNLEPALLCEECDAGFAEERKAVRDFVRLKEGGQ